MTNDNKSAPQMGEGPGVQARPDVDHGDHHQHTPEGGSTPASRESWEAYKERVRAANRLEEVVAEDASLEPNGTGLICSSPLRIGDSDPSFDVDPDQQLWIDRGTNVGGDVFRYVELRDGLSFRDAVRKLACRAGIADFHKSPPTQEELALDVERRAVEAILTDAAIAYHEALPDDVRAFLKSHYGFTDTLIDDEKIGYDPGGNCVWAALKAKGYSDEDLFRTGLFVEQAQLGRSRFHDRITMPYWHRKSVVYFCARATRGTPRFPKRDKDGNVLKNPDGSDKLVDPPKYLKLKTREAKPLYESEDLTIHSSISHTISNEWFAGEDVCHRSQDLLLIAEGMPDYYSVKQAGYAVISPVTVRFRKADHAKLLALSKHARQVVLVPDQERSGAGMAGATETAHMMRRAGIDVRIAILPHQHLRAEAEAGVQAKKERGESITTEDGNWKVDANEFLRDNPDGVEFRKLVEEAIPFIMLLVDRIPDTASGRDLEAHLRPVLELLASCDGLERDHFVDLIVERCGVKRGTISKMVADLEKLQAAAQQDESAAGTLVGILRNAKMATTSTGRVFADFEAESVPADSRAFFARVAAEYHKATGRLLARDTLQNAVMVVLGEGLPRREMPIRIGGDAEKIVVDMADGTGRAIVVSRSGLGVEESPIAFLRPDGTRPLPEPMFPADEEECRKTLAEYRNLLGVDKDTWASVIAFQLSSSRPMDTEGEVSEYAGLRIKAPEGAGKTTFERLVRGVLDPRDPDVIALPKDTANLAIAAENMHVLALDNLSYLDTQMSDALCRTATGDGYLTRSLYTDRDITVFKGSKPVVMTSITDVARNADLLDRFLVAELTRPKKRTTKKKVLRAFKAMHGRVLGALCYLIRKAIQGVDSVEVPDEVRMQEPCAFAMAAEKVAGLEKGSIVEAYKYAKLEGQEIVGSDPLVEAIVEYLQAPPRNLFDEVDNTPEPVVRTETVKDHLKELTDLAYPDGKRIPKAWPSNGRALRAALDRLRATLEARGVTIEFGTKDDRTGQAKERRWTFTFTPCMDMCPPTCPSQPEMDTSSNAMCPSMCPPNVSTPTAENQSRNTRMDTSDTFIPTLGGKEDEAMMLSASTNENEERGERSPNDVSNVSTSQKVEQSRLDKVDTLGGHDDGHVGDEDVSIVDNRGWAGLEDGWCPLDAV